LKSIKIDCEHCDNKDKSIFCQLEKESLQEVSDQKVMNVFKRGQVLFHEGNPAFGVYCISSGKVKLTKMSETGKETLLAISGPGDIVGFQHIIKAGVNDVTCTALEETKVCFIDRQFLNKKIQEEPSTAMELLSHLAKDMASMQERIAGFHSKNVRERVAYLLLELSKKYGSQTGHGVRIGIQLSRDEMASMLGIASETLIRELSVLKDEGIIEQDGKIIIVAKPKELEATINS
jgi:CRP-like cAMP-binding protein